MRWHNFHYYSLLLAMWFFSVRGLAQFERMDATSLQQIETYISEQKAAERMVGLSVGIIRDGEVVYLKGFGYEDSLANVPATEQTMYRLASISKSVTGLIAMRLMEQGRLDLDKDIRDYVPEYPIKPEGTITSEELLSNESGIIHYSGTGSGSYCADPYNTTAWDNYIASHTSEYDPVAAIDIFKDQDICFVPGAHYQYTTWGFCLMGAVLERAGGKPFETLLNEEIVCPLDLPTLQIEFQDFRPYDHEAIGYEFDNGVIIPTPSSYTDYQDISYKVPGGGLISSVIDLTLLMKGVVNREFLNTTTVQFYGTRHIAGDNNDTHYGYGTSTGIRNGDTLYWHSGSQAKTATLIYYSPENRNGVAIMCNTRGAYLYPLARAIYDYLPQVDIEGEAYELPEQNLVKLQTVSYDTICETQDFQGHTQSGTYYIPYTSSVGCDSVVETHLTVLPVEEDYCAFLGDQGRMPEDVFRIYPNPASQTLTIDMDGPAVLEIFGLSGSSILRMNLNEGRTEMNVSHIPSGVYYASFRKGEDQPEIQRLIITH